MSNQHIRGECARWAILASLVLTVGLAACNGQAGSTPKPTPARAPTAAEPAGQAAITVRSSITGAVGEAGQYLAQSQGYFTTEGLAVEFVTRDTTIALATLFTGQI